MILLKLWQAHKELYHALSSEEKDPAVRAQMKEAIACNTGWFGPPVDPDWQIEVYRYSWESSSISCCRALRCYMLLLGNGCNTPERLCSSIGHEMYHRVTLRRRDLCHPVWIDEMLACLAGGWFLQHKGFHEYANYLHRYYCEQPGRVDVNRLRKVRRTYGIRRLLRRGDVYPKGFYEGVIRLEYALEWIAGSQNILRIGKVKRLEDWIDSLPLENRYAACRVLQMPERNYPEPETARHHVNLARALFGIGDRDAALVALC